jgi:hypothetical protein
MHLDINRGIVAMLKLTSVERLAHTYGINIVQFGNSIYAKHHLDGREKRLGNWIALKYWTAAQWKAAFTGAFSSQQEEVPTHD